MTTGKDVLMTLVCVCVCAMIKKQFPKERYDHWQGRVDDTCQIASIPSSFP